MPTDGQLRAPATPACLDQVQDLIHTVTVEAGLAEDVTIRFETAAIEVLGNVIEHNASAGATQLCVTVEVVDGWLRGIVEDDGPPVPVDLVTLRMPGEMAVRGRGLAMADQLLDELHYERRGPRNAWRLGINLGS